MTMCAAAVACEQLESEHMVIMVTGDAPLTALHVAGKVGICDTTTCQGEGGARMPLLLREVR